jgi:hypothetical protein
MFKEKYGQVSAPSTSQVQLQDSLILLSGQWRKTGIQTLSTATGLDTGSIAASSFYYLYAVMVSGVLTLKASLSPQAPVGFSFYKKVGAFYTNSSASVFKAYSFGDFNKVTGIVQYANNGTLSLVGGDSNWFTSVIRSGVGIITATARSDMFAVKPMVFIDPSTNIGSNMTGAQAHTEYPNGLAASFVTGYENGANNTRLDFDFFLSIEKQGVDAIQPDWKDY